MTDLTKPREHWNTRLGVILAVIGSAVGLGNFLRFPGLAAKYEGGAFMIPYFIALLVLGLPLAWAEWSIGRYGGRRGYSSTPGIYWAISKNRGLTLLGVLGVIVPVIIYMYYVIIESWCLAYAWYFLDGTMRELGLQAWAATGVAPGTVGALPSKEPYNAFYGQFAGTAANGSAFVGRAALFLGICFLLNFALIYRGVARGIEKFCLVAMPLLIVCAVVVLVRVLTLPNVTAGLGFMWNPPQDAEAWSRTLLNPTMWLEATGQIFFTLSVGFGLIITYASYVRANDDIALSSLTAVSGNQFCEVALGGLITIPAAFLFLGAAQVTDASGSTFNLGFQTLPLVFEVMPMGYTIGFLFFFLLFLAAITSSLSMLQGAIALLEEGLNLNRQQSVALLGVVALAGSLFTLWFSEGFTALGTLDTWVGTLFIYLLATTQTLVFGWVLGVERGMAELDRGAAIRVPRLIGFMVKYVCPIYLGALFVAFLYDQIITKSGGMFADVFRDRAVLYSVLFMFAVIALFLFFIARAIPRWRQRDELAAQAEVLP